MKKNILKIIYTLLVSCILLNYGCHTEDTETFSIEKNSDSLNRPITNPDLSYEKEIEIDISSCGEKDCFDIKLGEFQVSKMVEIHFWADCLETFNSGYPKFYPMFYIYNRTGSPVKHYISVELHNSNREKLAHGSITTETVPYNANVDPYDIWKKISAIHLPKGIHKEIKYIKLVILDAN